MASEPTVSENRQIIARDHGVREGAVDAAILALREGHGRQAQFNHPDLGGPGQWSAGGMLMIGDMFNSALKAKVGALFHYLSVNPDLYADELDSTPLPDGIGSPSTGTWPKALGSPSSTGSQNGMRYAVFPHSRRLAVEDQGQITVYDTGDHRISGVSQQQSGTGSLRFSSQLGSFAVDQFPIMTPTTPKAGDPDVVKRSEPEKAPEARSLSATKQATETHESSHSEAKSGGRDSDSIFQKIENLHNLLVKGVISQDDFDRKKQELLDRI